MKDPVVFLDRDGTINEEVGYLNDPARLRLLPGAAEGIRLLNQAGLKVVVVTNQSGIARGYFTAATVEAIHQELVRQLAVHGARIDAFYYCPHHPKEGCLCRKPRPALVTKAARDLSLDLSRAYVVGDRDLDLRLAQNIGAKGILVLTGYGREEATRLSHLGLTPAFIAKDLLEAARFIVEDHAHPHR